MYPFTVALIATAAVAAIGASLPLQPVRDVQSFSTLSSRGSSLQTLINKVLSEVVALFPVNVAITDLTGAIAVGETVISDALGVSTTEDQTSGSCADVTVVFARGTSEAGDVGLLVGPPFFQALKQELGSRVTVAVQGVDYSATVEGYLEGGDSAGSQTMANDVSKALERCPNTKLVMSGYSQGGQVVHNAAKLLPSATMAKVNSVVIFGDPYEGQEVEGINQSDVLVICHTGDEICEDGDLILMQHLTYADDVVEASSFIAEKVG